MNKLLSVLLAALAGASLSASTPPRVETHLRLSRTECYGTCPAYIVDVWPDGRVRYEGKGQVDVLGVHVYRIAPAQVAALFERARAIGFSSMSRSYRAWVTDHSTTIVRVDLDGASHSVEDYFGESVGMPPAMRAFQQEIDRVTRVADFHRLGLPAVDRLQQEGFKFDSIDGATLLADATANRRKRDESALMRLVELGAPLSGAREQDLAMSARAPRRSVLEDALGNQYTRLAALLIARGALETNGRFDAGKRDDALIAAIRGGLLAPVQLVWNSGPGRGRLDRDALLNAFWRTKWYEDSAPQGGEIATWLTAQGVDLRGRDDDGDTLLHMAVSECDVELVRFAIAAGLDPDARDDAGYRPIDLGTTREIKQLLEAHRKGGTQ